MSLQWVVMGFLVGVLMVPVSSQEVINCDWLTPSGSSGCLQKADCSGTSGYGIYIWEDCAVTMELFTINTDTVHPGDCQYVNESSPQVISLKQELNAEDTAAKSCSFTGLSAKLFFSGVDINEFNPYPVSGTVSTMEVDVDENKEPGVIVEIYYSDEDYGETTNLDSKLNSSDYEDTFSLVPGSSANNIKTFEFSVLKTLDFETAMFYKVAYDIISTDERGNEKSSRQTFFVYVKDMPDNQPFWSKTVPVFALEECKQEADLFQVTAQDRDVEVNYDIKYALSPEEGSDYFKVDENSGMVTRIKEIDREALLEQGISSFSLTITATEYKKDGTIGEDPNSNEQVTIITVLDCNDQIPTFDQAVYEITTQELTKESGNRDLEVKIVVTDMDEGRSGSFTLETSDPQRLFITPASGGQTQEVKLTAVFQDEENNYFNYEVHKDDPLSFTITATETAEPSHTSTATVTIHLTDVNDNAPEFSQPSYAQDLNETASIGTTILTVAASDDDVHDNIGGPSIRYSLGPSCQALAINDVTGEVTLAMLLDFDDTNTVNEILCTVNARDTNGTGLQSTSEIHISVLDVVDEPPQFKDAETPMEITENSAPGSYVGSFPVTDADEGANIAFNIETSTCTKGTATPEEVNEWFAVSPDTPSPPEYPGKVTVGSGNPDREKCSIVTLTINAVDEATEANTNSATGRVVITIKDTKDEDPVFVGQYSNLNIDEFEENKSHDSVEVFTVRVSDPDEGDTIRLSVRNGGDLVELSPTEVTVEAGGEAVVVVSTKKDAIIDRETQDTLLIDITLTDSNNHENTKEFHVTVNDLNDNSPEINETLCDISLDVAEDDGTGSSNGDFLFNIQAHDNDKESPHNKIHYTMINDQLTDSKNLWTPFTVDETTGNVSILLIDGKKALDREQYAEWELLFRASDECGGSEPTCTVLTSELCKVTVKVIDVNDNYPEELQRIPNQEIVVTDFLKKDAKLNYTLYATDADEGDYADLTYSVISTVLVSSGVDMNLFRAEDDEGALQPSCHLFANEDFEGKNYTGFYNVTLRATDGGNLSTDFPLDIEVKDANDETPYFVLGSCEGEDSNTIKMEENAYTPGENGQPNPMEVKCDGPEGPQFTIKVEDTDTEQVNQEVTVKIDVENSYVEHLNGTEEELLGYWSLTPENCKSGCQLKVSHLINREEGTAYNLSLYVRNTAMPLKESWTWVRVVVTNKMEFPPFFCKSGTCSEVVYMYENKPDASVYFTEAKDDDNNGVFPGDDEYDNVYYFIVGGGNEGQDQNYFKTVSDTQQEIILKGMPKGLDREATQNYSLQIYVTNEATNGYVPNGDSPRNDTLELIIKVGDENDEDPQFQDDLIFSSFMESNQINDRLSVIEATDRDINETLKYTMLDDLQWFETTFTPDGQPFMLEENGNRSVYLTLNFDPKAMTQGYCNFTITVKDLAGHSDEAQVKVYVINQDYQVAMYFANTVQQVQSLRTSIEAIYGSVYGYPCTIDSIAATQDNTRQTQTNMTTVYMHFIDSEKNEPVADTIILSLSENAELMSQLISSLGVIGINLVSVDNYSPSTDENTPEEKILVLQILLGVVSLVLGSLLLLLITVYCLRTNKLERKIKVLSTNTFGSKEEGLNNMGLDVVAVPGSNYLAKEHGNHNPVFSETGDSEFRNQDTASISSGDSVLVGVEDNPEFKSYSTKQGTQAPSSQGYENPSFGRSIDEVSAPPPGVQGGMKGNPLLNLGDLKDDVEASAPSEEHAFGDSQGSEGDTTSVDEQINSNFSFF